MNKSQEYIKNVKIDEIPWNRLFTTYGTAKNFIKYFRDIESSNIKVVKSAIQEIASEIEHQDTLWHATPFAMIFLLRAFEKAINNLDNNVSCFLVDYLLSIFIIIAECSNYYEDEFMTDEKPLESFSDMLKEEYLYSEEISEDGEEKIEECYDFPGEVFYSFYYYSFQVVLSCVPLLDKINNIEFKDKIQKLKEILNP